MKTIEDIERALAQSRNELAEAQKKLSVAIESEKQLAEKRAPLLRDAKIKGDTKAQKALDTLTRAQFDARQEVYDLRLAIDAIQGEISDLEVALAAAQREAKIEILRELMSDRNLLGAKIEDETEALAKTIAEYMTKADEVSALIYELGLPNATTRAFLGKVMVKDFLQSRLSFVFPSLSQQESQKLSLTNLESQAQELLATTLGEKKAEAA